MRIGAKAPQELLDRINRYIKDHGSTMAWIILTSISEFLTKKGY